MTETIDRSRQVNNLQHRTVSIESLSQAGPSSDVALARNLIYDLMGSEQPARDEWGLRPFREIWVLFSREGDEIDREIGETAEEDLGQWINAFSCVNPREQFLQDFQQSLRQSLCYLFEGNGIFEQKDSMLLRLTAS